MAEGVRGSEAIAQELGGAGAVDSPTALQRRSISNSRGLDSWDTQRMLSKCVVYVSANLHCDLVILCVRSCVHVKFLFKLFLFKLLLSVSSHTSNLHRAGSS